MSPGHRDWTSAEIEALAGQAYRMESVRCPVCSASVKAELHGAIGRKTYWVSLWCERNRTHGEYSPDHIEAMDLSWSREEKIQIVERYWAQSRLVRCPKDQAVLKTVESRVISPGPKPIRFRCPQCGRHFSSSEVDRLQDADSFDAQYEVLRTIGAGGMGRVDLVRHKATGRQLAAKRIKPEFLRDAEAVRRFQREERILQKLTHDHIVPIEGSFVDESGAVLLMPYMPNGTLRQAIVGGTDGETLARYFAEMAEGLEFLHQAGVVHRDLKPDNVLIDDQGRARIADFGLARLIERDTTTLTARGDFWGTPHYAAPEQLADTSTATEPCDIHALGLIAYEIAKRQSPYTNPIRTERLCSAFRQAFDVAIAPDPRQRTITASELARALREELLLQTREVVEFSVAGSDERLRGWRQPRLDRDGRQYYVWFDDVGNEYFDGQIDQFRTNPPA